MELESALANSAQKLRRQAQANMHSMHANLLQQHCLAQRNRCTTLQPEPAFLRGLLRTGPAGPGSAAAVPEMASWEPVAAAQPLGRPAQACSTLAEVSSGHLLLQRAGSTVAAVGPQAKHAICKMLPSLNGPHGAGLQDLAFSGAVAISCILLRSSISHAYTAPFS